MNNIKQEAENDIYRAFGHYPRYVTRIGNGGNSRIFSFIDGGEKFCIKYYFKSSEDKRNRLKVEWAFLRFLEESRFKFCPRPIFANAKRGFLIMSLVEGKAPDQSHSEKFISNFSRFLNSINSEQNRDLGKDLQVAAEGAFDAASHIEITEQKFMKLKNYLDAKSALMLPEIEDVINKIEVKLTELTYLRDISQNHDSLFSSCKCISPSDFGFHNSIIDTKGDVNFIDFEYAGWDDPAKVVLDFFLHPAMSNSLFDLKLLMSQIEIPGLDSQNLTARCSTIYQSAVIRWSVTLLNIFYQDHQNKKLFIDYEFNIVREKTIQLEKSKNMLNRIDENPFKK